MNMSVEKAVYDLDRKWPDGIVGHYASLGNALYDMRQSSMADAFVCSKSEFEDEAREQEFEAERRKYDKARSDRMKAADKWARAQASPLPEGCEIRCWDADVKHKTIRFEYWPPGIGEQIVLLLPLPDPLPDFMTGGAGGTS